MILGVGIWAVPWMALPNGYVNVLAEGTVTKESHQYLGTYLGDNRAGWYIIYDMELNSTSNFTIKTDYSDGLIPWKVGDYIYIIAVDRTVTATNADELHKRINSKSDLDAKLIITSYAGLWLFIAIFLVLIAFRIHRKWEIVELDDPPFTPREKKYYKK